MRNSTRRIAALSAAGVLAWAGQASATPVECPSVTVTRVPIPAGARHAAPSKPRRQLAQNRPVVKRHRNTTVAALRAGRAHGPGPTATPDLRRPLPVLAPILPPDTLPATEPVLAANAAPAATPIVGYRLKRSVKMVACQPVPLTTSSRDLVLQLAGPGTGIDVTPGGPPLLGTPATPPLLVTTLPTTTPTWGGPGGGENPHRPPTLSPVPEPATWAMLIVGFFGLGARLRSSNRRRAGGAPTQAG